MTHAIDMKKAEAAGSALFAANSPQFRAIEESANEDVRAILRLTEAGRKLAESFAGTLGEEGYQRADSSEPSAQQKSDREYERALSEQIGRLVNGGYLG